jgi:hypothetical protein
LVDFSIAGSIEGRIIGAEGKMADFARERFQASELAFGRQPSRSYVLHYRGSYEQNFIIKVSVKGRLGCSPKTKHSRYYKTNKLIISSET